MVSATDAIVTVISPCARSGRSTSVSLSTPATPATRKAATADGMSGNPSHTFAQ
jgi:hypothetical protein